MIGVARGEEMTFDSKPPPTEMELQEKLWIEIIGTIETMYARLAAAGSCIPVSMCCSESMIPDRPRLQGQSAPRGVREHDTLRAEERPMRPGSRQY